MKVRVQVIKVYDVEVNSKDYMDVYKMSTEQIYEEGELIDVQVDNAETWDDDEISEEGDDNA